MNSCLASTCTCLCSRIQAVISTMDFTVHLDYSIISNLYSNYPTPYLNASEWRYRLSYSASFIISPCVLGHGIYMHVHWHDAACNVMPRSTCNVMQCDATLCVHTFSLAITKRTIQYLPAQKCWHNMTNQPSTK